MESKKSIGIEFFTGHGHDMSRIFIQRSTLLIYEHFRLSAIQHIQSPQT